MKNLITIDGGTTNTRVSLVKGDDIICTKRIAMGAGDCIQSADKLKSEIKLAIEAILAENSLVFGDIEAVVASGMITSEYGLYTLPHIVAPVGIKQLYDGMKKVMLEDICPLPFFFIPGVKIQGELCDTDMMRGEETELMGIMQSGGEAYVLPGSHSKLIFTD
ncbi:MAG: 2-dehydro-3-deoxygalactonokinase, partial [Clostridia bacterium]|nr:2-dehydro-3-deoxygalactonokinase [Clostridia bacterium]